MLLQGGVVASVTDLHSGQNTANPRRAAVRINRGEYRHSHPGTGAPSEDGFSKAVRSKKEEPFKEDGRVPLKMAILRLLQIYQKCLFQE